MSDTTAKKKTRSGNPATRAEGTAEVASASSIKEFKRLKKGRLLHLPSGLAVTARRVELRAFIKQGDVPNPLLPLVEDALNKGKGVDQSAFIDGDNLDMNMVNEMYQLVDQIVIACVLNPRVNPLPDVYDEEDDILDDPTEDQIEDAKDDDLLYIDEIDDEDKMFLFQWVTGGTEDVATFRREAEADLASLGQGKGGKKKSK